MLMSAKTFRHRLDYLPFYLLFLFDFLSKNKLLILGIEMTSRQCPSQSIQKRFFFSTDCITFGQRVRREQPDGGLTGLGISPFRMMRFIFISGFATGTADSASE